MKIKFFANYDSSENLLKRFRNNYPIHDDLLQFTNSDDYQVAVVFNRTYDMIKDTAKILTIIQEPSWSPVHHQNNFLTDSDYLVIHDKEAFEKTLKIKLRGEIIENPAIMWFHDSNSTNYNFFDGTENMKKKKKISMIVSSIYMSIGNYKKRIELLNTILASDLEIDIYGRGLQLNDKRYKGELVSKFTGLLPYEYSIAIENTNNEKNYLTEKFIDCVLCGTTPIYNGAPNANELYNSGGYELINLDSPTIIDDIKNIIQKPTNSLILKENKDKYFNEYNLYNLLKSILL